MFEGDIWPTNWGSCCCRANEASALEVGKVMGSKDADTDIVVADVNSDEGSSGVAARADGEGAAAPSTYQVMRSVLQKNVIWRALNYGMNYDIHKVRAAPAEARLVQPSPLTHM